MGEISAGLLPPLVDQFGTLRLSRNAETPFLEALSAFRRILLVSDLVCEAASDSPIDLFGDVAL